MVSTYSKFRNITNRVHQNTFYNLHINDSQLDGSQIDVSTSLLAVAWKSGGAGNVAVFDSSKPCRPEVDIPLIKGHEGDVIDVKFSPFNSNLLGTASNDGNVKIWEIPEEGLKENLTKETQKYSEHGKKVSLLSFHPTVKEIIASTGADHKVSVWDITTANTIFSVENEDNACALQWNFDGSLLGTMQRNSRKLTVFDPRCADKSLQSIEAFNTSKACKMTFLYDSYVLATGYAKNGAREANLYDLKNFDKPVQNFLIDKQSGIISPYFDTDTKLAFLPGRGEGNINVIDCADGMIKTCINATSKNIQKSVVFFPKRAMDYNSAELVRGAKLCHDHVEYVSFEAARRTSGFDASFYPETLSGQPSNNAEEWKTGVNKEPKRQSILEIENKFKTEVLHFEKKVEVKKLADYSKNELVSKCEELEKKVTELEAEVAKLKGEEKKEEQA